jgi:hypothetical protein
LEPGKEIKVIFRTSCIESLVDVSIIADPESFETSTEPIYAKHEGYFLKYKYFSGGKLQYGAIQESNELNNAAFINLGCNVPTAIKINQIVNTY